MPSITRTSGFRETAPRFLVSQIPWRVDVLPWKSSAVSDEGLATPRFHPSHATMAEELLTKVRRVHAIRKVPTLSRKPASPGTPQITRVENPKSPRFKGL
jgi:hypothetical protein